MGTLELRTEQRQSAVLSPRQQHAVRLLQMSSLDFAALLRDKLDRNPFLESEEGDDAEPPLATFAAGGLEPTLTGNLSGDLSGDRTADLSADLSADLGIDPSADLNGASDGIAAIAETDDYIAAGDDRDLWQADAGGSGRAHDDDGETSALDTMAVETRLNAHLDNQLKLLPLSERDLLLARAVVESLDDDGYLRTPLEELLGVTGLEPPPTLPEMRVALNLVQSLDPAGVGARSVGECLLLQLPTIACAATRELARAIVGEHLQALAARDIAALSRALGEAPAKVEAACDRIRRLDPHPGWQLGGAQIAYVVPDVVARKTRGRWGVQLNPAVVPRVRLNKVYAELFRRHGAAGNGAINGEMAEHLHEARWTLRNIEQRFATILDVAGAIVRRQQHFLEYGEMAMKPLGLREIADEVGVHESTVSRVTNNKYLATPAGVFELKRFFSRAMVSANGRTFSGTAVRGLIRDIVETENPHAPLSDAEIARQLAQQGLRVARRTVTKYRQLLKLEAVDRRRRHA
ncbi:MAG: RNA polymerase factor sigma-54 [Burkholderiales bacterium]|nr:RNA polymerase factor sigma-54 [Burkholderiales bacterium]